MLFFLIFVICDILDSGSESGSHKSGRVRTTAAADGKPTRVRTVLNEKQLHTLRYVRYKLFYQIKV
jgi:hypothetical protein